MADGLGNNVALFMLFNPITNYHYLMFQMGSATNYLSGSCEINVTFPFIIDSANDASVTTTVFAGDLTLNAATGSGQTGTGD
jgi:hypothetical protein